MDSVQYNMEIKLTQDQRKSEEGGSAISEWVYVAHQF